MWFNNITEMWTTKRELAGADPTSGPHPLIGKTFKMNTEDPFKEHFCKVLNIKLNSEGTEWVKYVALIQGKEEHSLTLTRDVETFNAMWKEV